MERRSGLRPKDVDRLIVLFISAIQHAVIMGNSIGKGPPATARKYRASPIFTPVSKLESCGMYGNLIVEDETQP